ncbi:hypothetical protein LEAN103870_14865 [Legionella anisa]|uniref:DUF995 domain-containing protein n=1 Tax=Legionella anisa TaxID=28082 RepID=A0AAX0WVC7_9GAMM|nr:hypothetical protein [Legionella anisa]AWN73506.1 hypothetical protein DLD14_06420 [Legionella anisa]KTC70811.1 hypothetical protein Lani_2358 [Legionella anisa]MBN5935350.1 hypothetical protein [Legionella anisa]MCW8426381.1 hypothetical protein [Legionella anisa]MCW8448041.1 hypothetical protein [Legionella anisa]
MKRLPIAAALLAASSLSFAASISSMSKSEVTEALSDKTVTTISAATLNDKVLANSFTGYFGKDGKMMGGFAKQTEGAPQNDKGTWLVKDDGSVCMTWEHWFNGKEECVYFYKLNNGLLVVGADQNFESVILNSEIKSGNQIAANPQQNQ